MSSLPTIDDTLSEFPNKLPKITELPDYGTLKNLRNLLKENATSVSSLRSDGNNSHLGLVVSDAIYAHIAPGTPWNIPARPATLPNIPNGATGPQISENGVRQHSEDLRAWKAYNNVEAALKKQLITAIPPTYLRAIKNQHSGLTNRTLREILAHLFTVYGNINPNNLRQNDTRFITEWDPNVPIENLIDQVEKAIDYADDGRSSYSNSQILNNMYSLVFNTGIYFDACKRWDDKPDAEKRGKTSKLIFSANNKNYANRNEWHSKEAIMPTSLQTPTTTSTSRKLPRHWPTPPPPRHIPILRTSHRLHHECCPQLPRLRTK
jgi:hypothetical protein